MLEVNIRTRRRQNNANGYMDVLARYADDDEVVLGMVRRDLSDTYWIGVVGDDAFRGPNKFSVVGEVCRVAGPQHFTGVVYKYGARSFRFAEI